MTAIVAAVTVLREQSLAGAVADPHGHGEPEPEMAEAPTGPAYDTAQRLSPLSRNTSTPLRGSR